MRISAIMQWSTKEKIMYIEPLKGIYKEFLPNLYEKILKF